ncbi:lytic murein transglycosylase [Phyllobacterium endophyticum]|uniref:lytic murein transglycosylase n=1 Tax=Phyllobacterium endophyticum TaxID=1149773 RepID=UPI0011C6FF39|nr:lytic murein transglycosylase [Phyllobacterium endophyticum]TXR47748.1 lytic murein transglycosylase [Phyllobacterium endophyticum]
MNKLSIALAASLFSLSSAHALDHVAAEQPVVAKPACGGELEPWFNGLIAEARAAGVGEKGLSELLKASMDDKVLERDRAQGVFNQTFLTFSSRMVSDYRLKQGAANLKKYADIFARAEAEFGVPGPVIASFWGLETDFGAVQGDFDTLNSLLTLSFDCRRPELFRPQLIALLKLFDRGVVDAKTTGAWAGEIGQMQMLPTDYLERGVDGDGDGKVDLKHSAPDAIMTAARVMRDLGWRKGEPWLEEVKLTQELPWENAMRTNRLPHSKWAAWGVTGMKGPLGPDDGDASLLLPMGRKGPAFLSYANFDIFVEWNKSIIYATTAAYFATRLAGAGPLEPTTPEQGLSPEQMKELQQKLAARGHDMGPRIDGVFGILTRDAVREEQIRLGMPADSWPTPELLSKL